MSTKDWPRLMSVRPVAVVSGEERTRLRAGQTFMAAPAYVTDGDALGDDEVFLFSPAGHQPDSDGIVTIRAARLAELERDAARWRFYAEHGSDIIQGTRLHEWIESNRLRLGGRTAAIDAARASEAKPAPIICGNCDTAVPPGCAGTFLRDGESCFLYRSGERANEDQP